MKVLGLSASPRKGGNSELAAAEIMRNLPENWEKRMIRLTDLKIDYCRGCYSCLPSQKSCILSDDMNFLLENLRWADKVVLTGAAHMLGGHASLKRIRDRSLCVLSDFQEFSGKDCVFAASYGLENWDGMVKEDFLAFARMFHLHVAGSALLRAALPGESVAGDNLIQIQKLARSLIQGYSDSEIEDDILCPYCGARGFKFSSEGTWRCLLCAGKGTLQFKNGKFYLQYDRQDTSFHFSTLAVQKHQKVLEGKKQLFLQNRKQIHMIQQNYLETHWIKPPHKSE